MSITPLATPSKLPLYDQYYAYAQHVLYVVGTALVRANLFKPYKALG